MNKYQITTTQRVNRCMIGAVLILGTMAAPVAPLGWLAVLPLIATLPVFAGMFGVDPVSKIISHEFHQISRSIAHHYDNSHSHTHG